MGSWLPHAISSFQMPSPPRDHQAKTNETLLQNILVLTYTKTCPGILTKRRLWRKLTAQELFYTGTSAAAPWHQGHGIQITSETHCLIWQHRMGPSHTNEHLKSWDGSTPCSPFRNERFPPKKAAWVKWSTISSGEPCISEEHRQMHNDVPNCQSPGGHPNKFPLVNSPRTWTYGRISCFIRKNIGLSEFLLPVCGILYPQKAVDAPSLDVFKVCVAKSHLRE